MPALRSPKGKERAVDPLEVLPSHSQSPGYPYAQPQQGRCSLSSQQNASEVILSESARIHTSSSSSQTSSSQTSSSQTSGSLSCSQEIKNSGLDLTPSQIEFLSSSVYSSSFSSSSQESNNLGFDLSSAQLGLLSPPFFSSPIPPPPTIPASESTITNELKFFHEFLDRLASGTEPTIPGIGREKDFIRMPDRYLLDPPPPFGVDRDADREHFLQVCYPTLRRHLVAGSASTSAAGSASISAAVANSSTATAVSTVAEAHRFGIDMILTLYLEEAERYNNIAFNSLQSSKEEIYKSKPMETQKRKGWVLNSFNRKPRIARPPWILKLKVGMPIILLQRVKGLEAGTRLIVTELQEDTIGAKIVEMVSGLSSSSSSSSRCSDKKAKAKARTIVIKRRVYDITTGRQGQVAEEKGKHKVYASREQFPVKSAFALAICDLSKGAKFEGLGLDLNYSLRSPGMLHDVLSRCQDPSRLKVFIRRGNMLARRYTRNVVPVQQ
ncbi:MAG: hypothetical protein J3R72DRAFT_448221 [Linnemannia gamsii]|nr:MAG: hypothetical protein J3R72DRAFT_448221 [Linnemannia gamsii]